MEHIRAFHPGRLVIFQRNGLQGGDIDEHAVAHIAPDADGGQAVNDLRGDAQRTGSAGQRREHVGVNVAPYLGRGHQRHGKGHEQQGAHHVVEGAGLPQKQRQRKPQHVCADDVYDGKLEGVPEAVPEGSAFEQLYVIFKADEVPFLGKNGLLVGKRRGDGLDKGNQNDEGEQCEGRKHEQDVSPVLPNGKSRQPVFAIQAGWIDGGHKKSAPAAKKWGIFW